MEKNNFLEKSLNNFLNSYKKLKDNFIVTKKDLKSKKSNLNSIDFSSNNVNDKNNYKEYQEQNLILMDELAILRKSLFELDEQLIEKDKLLTNYLNENNKLKHNIQLLGDESKMNFDLLVELKSNLENLKDEKENYKELSEALENQLNKFFALFGKLTKIKKIRKTRIDFQSIELDVIIPKN